jgi:hypothetical protein
MNSVKKGDTSERSDFKEKLAINKIEEASKPTKLKHAILIHNQTMAAVANFHQLYVDSQKSTTGSATHDKQDLLRAMLLFACSGLDAVVKQLIQDTLEIVLRHDEGAQREFKKFAERRLKKTSTIDDRDRGTPGQNSPDVSFLAELLVSFDPRSLLISTLTNTLVSDSLQSRDQLLKVATHFALTRDEVMVNDKITKEAFDARNQIAHEMDVDLQNGEGRRDRDYATMVRWSENIAEVSRSFIEKAAGKMQTTRSDPEQGQV